MLPKIRQLKSQNKGADAVNYIIALNLQNHFDTKELMKMFIAASKFKEAAQLAVPDPSLQKVTFFSDIFRMSNFANENKFFGVFFLEEEHGKISNFFF